MLQQQIRFRCHFRKWFLLVSGLQKGLFTITESLETSSTVENLAWVVSTYTEPCWDGSTGDESRWVTPFLSIDLFLHKSSTQAVYCRNNNCTPLPYSRFSTFLRYPIHTGASLPIVPAFPVKPASSAQTRVHAGAPSNLAVQRLRGSPEPAGQTRRCPGRACGAAGCPASPERPGSVRSGQERVRFHGGLPRGRGLCWLPGCGGSGRLRASSPGPRSARSRHRPAPGARAAGAAEAADSARRPAEPGQRSRPRGAIEPGVSRWDPREETLPPLPAGEANRGALREIAPRGQQREL